MQITFIGQNSTEIRLYFFFRLVNEILAGNAKREHLKENSWKLLKLGLISDYCFFLARDFLCHVQSSEI